MCVCVCVLTHTHEHTQVSVLTAAIEKAIKAEAEVLSLRHLGSSPQDSGVSLGSGPVAYL